MKTSHENVPVGFPSHGIIPAGPPGIRKGTCAYFYHAPWPRGKSGVLLNLLPWENLFNSILKKNKHTHDSNMIIIPNYFLGVPKVATDICGILWVSHFQGQVVG
jgi:hypothetical protein